MNITTGSFESDITTIISALGGTGLSLFTFVLVFFANIGTAGVGTYSYCIVAKSSFHKLKFSWAVIGLCAIMAVLAVSEKVTEYFVTYLSYSAFLYLSIMGVLLADVFIVRRQRFNLRALYGLDGSNPYRYTGGFNVLGFLCVAAGIATGCAIYNPMTGEVLNSIFDYTTASFPAFVVSGAAYALLSFIPRVGAYLRRDSLEHH
jgi:NCS1 family nucleobase:cation symporter-1